MSKGTRPIPVRIPAELLAEIDAAVLRSVEFRREEPWNRSTWIIQAIRDKLDHARRSNRRRKSTKESSDEGMHDVRQVDASGDRVQGDESSPSLVRVVRDAQDVRRDDDRARGEGMGEPGESE